MMTSSRGAVACKYKTAPIRSECEYCCWRADCMWDEIERLRAKAAQQKVAYDAYVCMEAEIEELRAKVNQLEGLAEAARRYVELKSKVTENLPPITTEQWAAYKVAWEKIVQRAIQAAAKAKSEEGDNGLNHPDDCDCEPCDERLGRVSYGEAAEAASKGGD